MENISNSSTVQADRREKKYLSASLLRAFILILFFLIFAIFAIGYGILKRLPYIPEDVADVVLESLAEDICPHDQSKDTDTDYLVNQGWNLYKNIQHGFSIEIPSFLETEDQLNSEYVWSISTYEKDTVDNKLQPDTFSNFVQRTSIYLTSIENTQQEIDTEIYLDLYIKDINSTTQEVEEEYLNKVEERVKDDIEILQEDVQVRNSYTSQPLSDTNLKGFSYEIDNVAYKESGRIILSDRYIVHITVEPFVCCGEQLTGAQQLTKIIESIIFF